MNGYWARCSSYRSSYKKKIEILPENQCFPGWWWGTVFSESVKASRCLKESAYYIVKQQFKAHFQWQNATFQNRLSNDHTPGLNRNWPSVRKVSRVWSSATTLSTQHHLARRDSRSSWEVSRLIATGSRIQTYAKETVGSSQEETMMVEFYLLEQVLTLVFSHSQTILCTT